MTDREISSLLEVEYRIPETRHIHISGVLSHALGTSIKEQLTELNKVPGDILCLFDSRGGDTQPGLHLYQRFRKSPNRVIGLVKGNAQSSAFIAFQGCRVRLSTANAVFRIHSPEFYPRSRITHSTVLEDYLDEQRKLYEKFHPRLLEFREKTIQVITERSKMHVREEIELFLESEMVMCPQEALVRGFLDKII